ncbi:hypothetical protein TgHK011_008266 [Trichoderma gracile]|nr:hypothetical protein TgHK011_008266 [Trichoderma gracile]
MAYPRTISSPSSTNSSITVLNIPHCGKIPPAPGWKHAKASRKPGLGSCRIVLLLDPALKVELGHDIRPYSTFDMALSRLKTEPGFSDLNHRQ